MNKQAYLEEIYRSSFNDELEKLSAHGSATQKAINCVKKARRNKIMKNLVKNKKKKKIAVKNDGIEKVAIGTIGKLAIGGLAGGALSIGLHKKKTGRWVGQTAPGQKRTLPFSRGNK